MQQHVAVLGILFLIVRAATSTSTGSCAQFGYSRSVLNLDLEWVMQGYQIGFQGFFVELLGFSESIVQLLPQARLTKSSFRQSFAESPFPGERFLNQELFQKEEDSIRTLATIKQVATTEQAPSFLGSKQLDSIDCSDASVFEPDFIYNGSELAKHVAPNASTPAECCSACVVNPLCLAWSFEAAQCSLKGRMEVSGVAVAGATSGRMILRSNVVQADVQHTGDAPVTPAPAQVRRRAPVPRVIVFHGTTCIHLNHSVSMATRDINTILIARYMLERPYLVGGYNLDEYAVMHCAARMDEIWVPTDWHRGVFQRLFAQQGSLSSMPLISVIPEAVDTELFDPDFDFKAPRRSIVGDDRQYVVDGSRLAPELQHSDSSRQVVQERCAVVNDRVRCEGGHKFEFLSIFKWEYRKGWDVMLDAFWQAFTPEDDVILRVRSYVPHTSAGDRNLSRVIATYAERVHGKALSELATVVWETGVEGFTVPRYDAARAPGNVEEQSEPSFAPENTSSTEQADPTQTEKESETHLTREDMRSLLASANAFVLATRGEGWGLPIAEAMSMALPVIVTNHSGPAAYATADNAYLIPVLGSLDEYSFAKPDVAVLAHLFKQVVLDSSEEVGHIAQQKGQRARRTMKEFSPDSIVCKMNERLRYHASLRGWQLP
jgi:glycosyltransferase involved in cell wall biosynthesis